MKQSVFCIIIFLTQSGAAFTTSVRGINANSATTDHVVRQTLRVT